MKIRRPLRILILGNTRLGYSWFVLTATQGAVLLGHQVRHIDFKTNDFGWIREQTEWFRPDLILTHIVFHKPVNDKHGLTHVLEWFNDLRKALGTKICYNMGDARTTPRYPHDISSAFDLGLVNNFDPETRARFEQTWKVPTIWWPYSALWQKTIADPAPDLKNLGLVYTGSLDRASDLHRRRTEFVEQLKAAFAAAKLPFTIYQTQDPKGDMRHRTAELSASTGGVLGLPADNDVPGYLDVRPFQYGGAGAVLYHREVPALEKVFNPARHYIGFNGYNPEAVVDLFKRMQKPSAAAVEKRVRLSVFTHVQKHHCSINRMEDIIEHFGF